MQNRRAPHPNFGGCRVDVQTWARVQSTAHQRSPDGVGSDRARHGPARDMREVGDPYIPGTLPGGMLQIASTAAEGRANRLDPGKLGVGDVTNSCP